MRAHDKVDALHEQLHWIAIVDVHRVVRDTSAVRSHVRNNERPI